jgi:hypothetical protein
MDHVVYVDNKAEELEKLLGGEKSMLIRGAAGRKMPHGRVESGDVLYLVENDGSGLIKARCDVLSAFHSEKMDKAESTALVDDNQDKLQLTAQQYKRWAGKRYLVLIEVGEIEALEPFEFDRSEYGNMDDWLRVEDINTVRL